MTEPRLKFDWIIYADATFAGLSVLIPIPLLDVAFEHFFRRRMPGVIGKRNGRSLNKETIRELNRLPPSCLQTCLGWPILILFTFLKRLYRTILYFLTLKDASDNLSLYWHRAFLLDYIIGSGYVDDPITVPIAAEALRHLLDDTTISPLSQLAQEIVASVRHVFATLRRVIRRGEEDDVVAQAKERMATLWSGFDEHFVEVAARYDEQYTQLLMNADNGDTEDVPQAPISSTETADSPES